ncbi:MAG: sulfotransferase family 2 domain-containing protein [Pseudomonadota bacterium]
MPLAHAPDGRAIYFAHVPKAGGSSVEDRLEARFGPLQLLDRAHEPRRRARATAEPVSPQHMPGAEAARRLPQVASGRAWRFAVVRDPLRRLLSAHRFQFHGMGREDPARRPPPWRARFARLGLTPWLALSLAATRLDPGYLDGHLRPQVDFLPPDPPGAAPCETFRLEDGLQAVEARLDALFGPGPAGGMGHALRAGKRDGPTPSRTDLRLILRAHGADYDRFGYARPDPAAAPRDPWGPARVAQGLALVPLALALHRGRRM